MHCGNKMVQENNAIQIIEYMKIVYEDIHKNSS